MEETKQQLPCSSESGASLIEVLISMLVLGVVLVALGQGLTLGISMNTETKNRLANLNLCKRITESIKSQIESTQTTFDGANGNSKFNGTFYVDADGNEITNNTTPGGNTSTQETLRPAFQVTISVRDWQDAGGNTLSQTDSLGVSHVLLKTLEVKIVAHQSAVSRSDPNTTAGSSREVKLQVEIARPASG